MMGLASSLTSKHVCRRETDGERECMFKPCGFIFYSNIVTHHNNQEVKCKTDLGSLTLGLLHLYFNANHLFNNTSC